MVSPSRPMWSWPRLSVCPNFCDFITHKTVIIVVTVWIVFWKHPVGSNCCYRRANYGVIDYPVTKEARESCLQRVLLHEVWAINCKIVTYWLNLIWNVPTIIVEVFENALNAKTSFITAFSFYTSCKNIIFFASLKSNHNFKY